MRNINLGLVIALFFTLGFPAIGGTAWNNPPKRTRGEIQHRTFHSASLATEIGYNICLPPDYKTRSEQRFPVIYYLHGYQGNESSYLDYAKYWQAGVRSSPVILVFVNGGETSFFSDSPDDSIPGERVVKELVSHIDGNYRTLTNSAGRSLHGYSMGGFGALKLAFKYPDVFGSVVAYGATLPDAAEFRKHLGKVFKQSFGNDAKRFAENDPFVLAERNADRIRGQVGISLVIGTKDDFLPRYRALRQILQQLRIPHVYEEVRGAGHNKDDLYENAAMRGFAFSAQHFGTATNKTASLDKQ